MAKEIKETKIETPEKTTAVAKTAEPATFEAGDIAANATRLFGYSRDLAVAALEHSGIQRCTLEKAKSVIKEFAERKVT